MSKPKYRAYLCFGPNCGPKGSGELLRVLEAELESAGLGEQVSVLPTGCQAHCESGPTMVVYPGPVYYQAIDRERLARIVQGHFIEGEPVAEYFWTGVRKRILPDGSKVAVGSPKVEGEVVKEKQGQSRRGDKGKSKRAVEDVDDFKW